MVVTVRPWAATASVRQDKHALAVDMDGAGAALAVVAALLRAGQVQVLAQRVQQRRAGVEQQPVIASVDVQRHGHRPRYRLWWRLLRRRGAQCDRYGGETHRPAEQAPAARP